ncbi:hypothetical protein [Georgenia subflava]|uniref:Uncharacterized protein n=1 Tax=Georgenia subflava TaxID=1622177 RepID=A0A6N7ETK7_9MICO|nr:hypothetical protein [Georgenia subflava]MPV38504.1 hypothetical protein [Georgenia subflava]
MPVPPAEEPVPTAKPTSRRVPPPLLVACLLVALESAALVGMAVTFVVDVVRGATADTLSPLALAVFFVGFALLIGGAARALWRGRRWGRGPVVTWQVLQAASVLTLAGSLSAVVVVLVVAVSLAVVVGVLWPSSREHASAVGAPTTVV